ncbi:flavin-dependent dehydrogenase [Actinomycetospora succinea]|uniref:Flavin-dependent dehydrogenase n=1 Tax=Actinomycetospora succinea TaxID=663603 RepID=A0A4R6UZX5_9PSEU|nr:flavin-dependent dehydrogenase [Actinomycetospora succinea]
MDTVVVGAGPTGLVSAVALARRGHRVSLVDNDPGPTDAEHWSRRGVMQFHHPHGFRPQAVDVIRAEMPEAFDALLAHGAEPFGPEGPPAGDEVPRGSGLRCRRMVVERELRRVAESEPGLTRVRARADAVVAEEGRAAGVGLRDGSVPADLVLVATGRTAGLADGVRAPVDSIDCGIAYVSRQYRLHPGAGPARITSPIGAVALHVGYVVIVFLHDAGTFSTLIARPSTDRRLADLRHEAAWSAATAAIPLLADWTDPARSAPISPVLPGGRLHNTYRGQLDDRGRVPLPGLVFVGDSVCTTNPTAGRGVSTSLMQVEHLLALLDEGGGADPEALALAQDAWCHERIRPWFVDHLATDASQTARWAGEDVDPTRPPTSDLVVSALEADPSLMAVVGPYLSMRALPDSLAAVHPRVQEIYASGWRPPVAEGPTVDELAGLVASVVGPAAAGAPPAAPATARA